MLCTFTTKTGDLIVRSEDIRRMEDDGGNTHLVWMEGDLRCEEWLTGTAAANRDQNIKDELDMIARVEAHRFEIQKQLQAGFPVPPVQRGKQAAR